MLNLNTHSRSRSTSGGDELLGRGWSYRGGHLSHTGPHFYGPLNHRGGHWSLNHSRKEQNMVVNCQMIMCFLSPIDMMAMELIF